IGHSAALWLTEAGANGISRVRAKMADAVALARLSGSTVVDWALGRAAVYGRFAESDLASIIAHRVAAGDGVPTRPARLTASNQAPAFGRDSRNDHLHPDRSRLRLLRPRPHWQRWTLLRTIWRTGSAVPTGSPATTTRAFAATSR